MPLFEQTFRIKGRKLLPMVQGGMGVAISAHRLAGTGAKTTVNTYPRAKILDVT